MTIRAALTVGVVAGAVAAAVAGCSTDSAEDADHPPAADSPGTVVLVHGFGTPPSGPRAAHSPTFTLTGHPVTFTFTQEPAPGYSRRDLAQTTMWLVSADPSYNQTAYRLLLRDEYPDVVSRSATLEPEPTVFSLEMSGGKARASTTEVVEPANPPFDLVGDDRLVAQTDHALVTATVIDHDR